jgi:hypothetical protein
MTTNIELESIAKQLSIPHFRGVFMKDQLKDMVLEDKECGIVNFERSNQNGSHWVGYYRDGKHNYYFDSYGSYILEELKNYLKSRIKTHNFQIQELNSDICGELTLLWLFLMSKGIPYEEAVLSLVSQ